VEEIQEKQTNLSRRKVGMVKIITQIAAMG
jgi:hypothetical protein